MQQDDTPFQQDTESIFLFMLALQNADWHELVSAAVRHIDRVNDIKRGHAGRSRVRYTLSMMPITTVYT